MEKKPSGVQSLRIYNASVEIATEIYHVVSKWDSFDKDTMGSQVVRAADSVSNNIAEGYSRVSMADRLNFLIYGESSLQEVRAQLANSLDRCLINEDQFKILDAQCIRLSIGIIEFCSALLAKDTTYKGKYRDYITRRRSWRVK
jgi:four helix bundle protein